MNDSTNSYFERLLPQLADRSRDAILGRLGFNCMPLQRHLRTLFSRPYGEGSLLADPTFEAVFGWRQAECTLDSLSGGLLHPRLVDALDRPPKAEVEYCPGGTQAKKREKRPYRFSRDSSPYIHQFEAWDILKQEVSQSIIVSSGTGSGKTECFMVPILDRLTRQLDSQNTPLTGVRALFLYPLNALINSQQERLRAWTNFADGDIRFCLYNGNTPEQVKAENRRKIPNEVLDRKQLRDNPPPILVTNATMLEYMLVRAADAPILEQSQGKLEWVVLDEAHSYVGSQAAELALLIRRVLHAFGVKSSQVRFVATSATIGDPNGKAGMKLKQFLADVAGIDIKQVHLVAGQREIPALMSAQSAGTSDSVDKLPPPEYTTVAAHPLARRIRALFTEKKGTAKVARLSEVCRVLFGTAEFYNQAQQNLALRWLDCLSGTISPTDQKGRIGAAFLPLRAHIFHQTLSGLWACSDPYCTHRGCDGAELDASAWPFGKVYLEPRKHCECSAPIYELVACDDCGEPFLLAEQRGSYLLPRKTLSAIDEFELDVEGDTDEDESLEYVLSQVLVVNRTLSGCEEEWVSKQSRTKLDGPQDDEAIALRLQTGVDHCPCCHGHREPGKRLFQEARIGAPFALSALLPQLLEYAPDEEECSAIELPYRGRRLLTFNDSRQGTARMAARLQQESERSRIRGLVYHLTLQRGISKSTAEADELLQEIHELEEDRKHVRPERQASLSERIDNKRKKLSELTEPKPIPFNELAHELSQQGTDFTRMLEHYRDDISRTTFGTETGVLTLAKLFLIREFGRRPKRLNNLETMGLVAVHYPALAKITKAPEGLALVQWKNLLKVTLDIFIRSGGSLRIDKPTRHWLGIPFPQNWLIPADRDEKKRDQRRWPKTKHGNRLNDRSMLVRLLSYALKLDPETPYGEDKIDGLLRQAWATLTDTNLKILLPSEAGHYLPLEALAFTPISRAWICPITHRILDTTLDGITPYLPRQATDTTAKCTEVEIPVYDLPMGGDLAPMAQLQRAREWLLEQPGLAGLRERGIWSPLNDRTIELAPYFTAAEHSAQQTSIKLKKYESDFKHGKLNLLSCSTTMEMGIDIGGIGVVAMNNVPPHPANYLQRAGRAGRRQEARSLAFTLCKSNPHDQSVFAKSDWPFTTPLPAPVVSLSSPVIVQRHVNALVLSHFLRQESRDSGQDLIKLNCGWFFTPEDEAPIDRLLALCRETAQIDDNLHQGIKQLVIGSVMASHPTANLVVATSSHLHEVTERWRNEWNALCREEDQVCGSSKENPACIGVRLKKQRVEGEYLLRELAEQGFLPAYGFPTHIAAFDNLTATKAKEIWQANKRELEKPQSERVDNRFRHRELASRDTITALREYAPGAELVMDGLVYRSAGLTLNWKIPPNAAGVNEVQNLRFAWICKECASTGTSHLREEASVCGHCGTKIEQGNIQEFIEPAGFTADYYKEPHNDITTQSFIPVEQPWVSGNGEWQSLANPTLGRFRVTTRGHIFHQSRGANGRGYSLCLECGRAEPMTQDGMPGSMERHLKLRGDNNSHKLKKWDDSWREPCPGNSQEWSFKNGIALGVEAYTDVLELQLANSFGVWLNDKGVTLTLSIAIRDALAGLLGVRAEELGCLERPARSADGGVCRSILIFDHHAAGYASSAGEQMENLFDKARDRLHCPSECDSACPHCVLDFDQRFNAELLNRYQAIDFLTDEWLAALSLPQDLRFFGEHSRAEYAGLEGALLRQALGSSTDHLRIFIGGDEADLGPSPLRSMIYRLTASSIPVHLMVASHTLATLSDEERYLLASLADTPGVTIYESPSEARIGNGWLLAEAVGQDSSQGWAVSIADAQRADSEWGTARPLVTGAMQPTAHRSQILSPVDLRPINSTTGDRLIHIRDELSGELQYFGQRFWSLLAEEYPPLTKLLDSDTDIASVRYHDRYLFSPLPVAILLNLIKSLRDRVGPIRWSNTLVEVVTTTQPTSGGYGNRGLLWSDWADMQLRDDTIESGLDNIQVHGHVHSKEKRQTEHGRLLEVLFTNGQSLQVRLDQGLGYWRVGRASGHRSEFNRFDFSAESKDQGEKLALLNVPIVGLEHPTQVMLSTSINQ